MYLKMRGDKSINNTNFKKKAYYKEGIYKKKGDKIRMGYSWFT